MEGIYFSASVPSKLSEANRSIRTGRILIMHDDDIMDLFEELSAERETQRDKKHWEQVSTKPFEKPEIVDTGEECIGG
jgi:hypothetical protein